ncbi:hypothetical protein N7516_005491 [Penicillium verrucosum]|uniref:uncharacterized protein n=1 Tax=Penicillium verrucosum TaxID=60171 RepID=UPI0025456909|nr:uncharacterized protein N7516_005491 [Penicillium verrucosum]KAJ5945323.1 hypothetical protein N7516_005491 [Penicillium verrucosum]
MTSISPRNPSDRGGLHSFRTIGRLAISPSIIHPPRSSTSITPSCHVHKPLQSPPSNPLLNNNIHQSDRGGLHSFRTIGRLSDRGGLWLQDNRLTGGNNFKPPPP